MLPVKTKIIKLALIFFFQLLIFSSKSQSIKIIELQPEDKNNSPANIKVIVQIDTLQKKSNKGIVFSLTLNNTAADSIYIYNPINTMVVGLINEKRENVVIKNASKVSIYDKTLRNKYISNKGYYLEKVSYSKKAPLTDIGSDVITISPYSEINYQFSIKIIKDDTVQEKITDTKAGKYLFNVFFGISPANQSLTRELNFKPTVFKMDLIPISFSK